ncbi:MAG: hypothetical protein QOH53_565, partial [Ilumatobacteraceae bacterium]
MPHFRSKLGERASSPRFHSADRYTDGDSRLDFRQSGEVPVGEHLTISRSDATERQCQPTSVLGVEGSQLRILRC